MLVFKSMNQSIHIFEMKTRYNHQAFIRHRYRCGYKSDTGRVIGPKEIGN